MAMGSWKWVLRAAGVGKTWYWTPGRLWTVSAASLARGLGEHYEWRSLDSGLVEARTLRKPLMLVVHKSWCGTCKAFKPAFASSREILRLSSHFVMVNVQDEEEPTDIEFRPDGNYIPRILFLDPDGKVRRSIYNEEGNPRYKYYYGNAASVASAMKRALKMFGQTPNDGSG